MEKIEGFQSTKKLWALYESLLLSSFLLRLIVRMSGTHCAYNQLKT